MAPKGKKRPSTRGGSSAVGSTSRGPSQGFVGEAEEDIYSGATSPPLYDISITRHFEMDLRKLFSKHSGMWFADILREKHWDLRFGHPDWFFRLELVNKFRRTATFGENYIVLPLTVNPDGATRVIDRQYISRMTKIPLNPLFNLADHRQMDAFEIMEVDENLDYPRLRAIAPYMDKDIHVSKSEKGLKAIGLQENVCLVAKWFSQNVLGTSKLNILKGHCCWFLDCLMYNRFPPGWCICQTMVDALIKYRFEKDMPLPFLVTAIMVKEFKLKRLPSDNPQLTSKAGILLKTNIPGMWTGSVVTDVALRPRVCLTSDDWNSWVFQFGRNTLTGGGRFHGKNAKVIPPGVGLNLDEETGAQQMDVDAGATTSRGQGSSIPPPQTQAASSPPLPSTGPLSYAPYTYDAYPGPLPPYSSPAFIPTAAFFDGDYGSQIPHEDLLRANWSSSCVTNRLLDGLHQFWQTGMRLDPHPQATTDIPPPSTGQGEDAGVADS